MSADRDEPVTRGDLDRLVETLMDRVRAEIHRQHYERERSALIAQGRWAPPPSKEA